MTKAIIEQNMGGLVSVSNTDDGAIFVITIPENIIENKI